MISVVKSACRFVFFWRYLLLACHVLVVAGRYLVVGSGPLVVASSPSLQIEPAPRPLPLRVRLEKVEFGMNESQILEILGSPQSMIELEVMDTIALTWREGRNIATVYFIWREPAKAVYKKCLTTPEERAARY